MGLDHLQPPDDRLAQCVHHALAERAGSPEGVHHAVIDVVQLLLPKHRHQVMIQAGKAVGAGQAVHQASQLLWVDPGVYRQAP